MKALIDHLGYVPQTCVWEITRACNLRCGHCGTGAGQARPDELTTEEAVGVAQDLARLGNRLTTLSGGEPTLRRDWPAIAHAFVEAGVTVNMVTNGQSDGAELAAQARDVGLANVAVSIDGLRETHDSLRAPGTFDRSMATIRSLVAAGIWVDVMCTANRRNLNQLADLYALAGRVGARGFRVQLGKPMGNQTHRDDLTLEPEQLLELIPLLGRLARQRGPVVRIGDSVGYYSPEERVLRGRSSSQGHWTGCYAGVRAIGIQADGGVKGCLSLQPRAGDVDRFVEGNLRHDSLDSIWFRKGAFAYNRDFQLGNLTGACARCTHASLCRGGAKCVAYTYTGELGCDPMCYCQVAGLTEATRHRIWPLSASAAAATVMASMTGCSDPQPDYGTSAPEYGVVQPDYGVIEPDYGVIEPDYGVVEPEYGMPEPIGGAGGEGPLPASAGEGGTNTGQGGTNTGQGGTNTSQGGTNTGQGGTSAGGAIATGGSGGAVDCESICCECDYGIIDPQAYATCCK